MQDIKLDVPFAEEYVGTFLADAHEHFTPELQEFIRTQYPKVQAHMERAMQEARALSKESDNKQA